MKKEMRKSILYFITRTTLFFSKLKVGLLCRECLSPYFRMAYYSFLLMKSWQMLQSSGDLSLLVCPVISEHCVCAVFASCFLPLLLEITLGKKSNCKLKSRKGTSLLCIFQSSKEVIFIAHKISLLVWNVSLLWLNQQFSYKHTSRICYSSHAWRKTNWES